MANFNVGKVTPLDTDVAVVGLATGQILPFRYTRAGLVLTNISDNWVSIRLDGTAEVNMYTGITLSPGGGTWTMDEYTFTNEKVYAKASGAGSTLCIQEFIDGGQV